MQKLELRNLAEYDMGSVEVLFNQALNSIYLDCEDRPLLKKDRTLTLQIKIKPREVSENADLEDVVSEISVKTALPDKEARSQIIVPVKKLGGFGFEPDRRSARGMDPNQQTLPIEDDAE